MLTVPRPLSTPSRSILWPRSLARRRATSSGAARRRDGTSTSDAWSQSSEEGPTHTEKVIQLGHRARRDDRCARAGSAPSARTRTTRCPNTTQFYALQRSTCIHADGSGAGKRNDELRAACVRCCCCCCASSAGDHWRGWVGGRRDG
jgi:hypothetical protein